MKQELVMLKIDPNMVQFPIKKTGKTLEVLSFPRMIMLGSDRFLDDETIHMIAYDPVYKVMQVIKHEKNTNVKKKPIEVIPIAYYFGLVEQSVFDDFMNASNKTEYFDTIINDKYISCEEPIQPYFLY